MDEIQRWIAEILSPLAAQLGPISLLLVASAVVYLATRIWLVRAVRRLTRMTSTTWDDALVEQRVFLRLAHVAPAWVIYYWLPTIDNLPEEFVALVERFMVAAMVVIVITTISALLDVTNEIYSRNPEYRRRPIKGYVQLANIFLYALAAISVVSILLNKSPLVFISGIGAMTAVLLLIFKDTILSLVASVQIATNDMIHVGDWVEMPQCGADGDVIDIALHTVKIQNWDKTITTVPTHRFIEEGFKNWRGMSKSGGRRIKRAVQIDISSIRFLEKDEIDRFEKWSQLRDYIAEKKRELAEHNADLEDGGTPKADLRLLTNVGTFRAYVFNFLKHHPKIHDHGFTLIVRQLEPGAQGLPIELYCFSNDQDWERYEGIQSDIFDHILAILPEFGLRAYQAPTGADFAALAGRMGGAGHG